MLNSSTSKLMPLQQKHKVINPFMLCGNNRSHYSSLSNRRVARSKRCGGKDEPFLISAVPNNHGGENFQASCSDKNKNKMN